MARRTAPDAADVAYQTGNTGLARDLNRIAVLRLIGAAGPVARNTIARQLGLSPATVTSVTRELLGRGILREAAHVPSSGGRPAVLLELVGTAATAFGAKIAPDHIVGVRVDLDGKVLERFEARLEPAAPQSAERIAAILEPWIAGSSSGGPLLGIGLGVPGVVDTQRRTVSSPALGLDDPSLGAVLEARLGVPVLVDNDVNTLAIWERLYGRGLTVEHFVTVTIGHGVGLGIVAGGDIYRGAGGGAGEFGHVTVVEDGELCSCGKRGCLETVVSDRALVAAARRQGVLRQRQGIARLRALADDGDEGALAIFAHAGGVLGRSVAGLVNILSPALVFVGGEGTQSWPHFASSFERELRANAFPPLRNVDVEIDAWDDVNWAIGAAALVLRATFTPHDAVHADNAIRTWLHVDPERLEVGA